MLDYIGKAEYLCHIYLVIASINQSINQSINHIFRPSINQSIKFSDPQSINQSIKFPDQSINQSINQSIEKSSNPLFIESINQSIGRSYGVKCLMNRSRSFIFFYHQICCRTFNSSPWRTRWSNCPTWPPSGSWTSSPRRCTPVAITAANSSTRPRGTARPARDWPTAAASANCPCVGSTSGVRAAPTAAISSISSSGSSTPRSAPPDRAATSANSSDQIPHATFFHVPSPSKTHTCALCFPTKLCHTMSDPFFSFLIL